MIKIFNCSTKQNKLGFTKNVQKNVSLLLKHFGPKFKIKDKKIIVPVRIIKEKFRSNNFEYLSLVYDQPERIHDLIPFKIDFYDINTSLRGGVLYPALDPSIFEVKFPNTDIKGKVLGDNLGVRE